MKENTILTMRELVEALHKACVAYYQYDQPVMSDKEYDDLYDKLIRLEDETGIVLASSPTQKVQGYLLDGFKKVTHTKPMLSAAKTKDPKEIEKFLNNREFYASYKLDGLTVVLRYSNGEFVQGITRGNGQVGEDITESCKFISNLPMKIPYQGDLELRGECVMSWEEFERINEELGGEYKHPRNLTAGTLRNLDLNIVRNRELRIVIFEVVKGFDSIDSKYHKLNAVEELGLEVVFRYYAPVPKSIQKTEIIQNAIDLLSPENSTYPVDGLVFELLSEKESKAAGATEHHENCRIALKWKDDLYETELEDVVWQTSKTGQINPVVVFKEVDLDGALTTRASLFNVSIVKKLELGIGDTIQVYRANMVIPQVYDNLTRSNTIQIPITCPCCGGEAQIMKENDSEFLMCMNQACKAKLLGKLVQFCSRDGMNIEGLNEATLEFLIGQQWIKNRSDIFELGQYKREWENVGGFGRKSVQKVLDSIEKSKVVTLHKFIYALSIPLIGKSASKDLADYYNNDFSMFIDALNLNDGRLRIPVNGFGEKMMEAIYKWWDKKDESDDFTKLTTIVIPDDFINKPVGNSLKEGIAGKTFVITGKLGIYKNRAALVEAIETCGGKVSGSVSKSTSYLINNDIESNSGKNKKAKELGIPIISEAEVQKMLE